MPLYLLYTHALTIDSTRPFVGTYIGNNNNHCYRRINAKYIIIIVIIKQAHTYHCNDIILIILIRLFTCWYNKL